jgi:hypothetical protein
MTFPASTYDSFSRTGSTFGVSDNGHDWQGDTESFYSTNSTQGLIEVNSSSHPTYDTAYIDLAIQGVGVQDTSEVLALFRWSSPTAYPNTDFGPMLCRTSANTFYFVRLQDNYDELAIACYVNGTLYELNRTSKVLSRETDYWIRFQRHSTGLRVRIWNYGTAEPTSWTLTSGLFDGSNPPSAGNWGWATRKTSNTHTVKLEHFYAYTLEDSTINTTPVTDNFNRYHDRGWGVNQASQPWEGNVVTDPRVLTNNIQGTVVSGADGYAQFTSQASLETIGVIGPALSGNLEALVRFSFDNTSTVSWFQVGLRGDYDISTGVVRCKGYTALVTPGATGLSLFKKVNTSDSGHTFITPSSSTAFTALAANTQYWIRFQIVGTTLQARLWQDGTGEPGTWHVVATDSSITGSGRLFVVTAKNTDATTRLVRIYEITQQLPTTTTNHTTTGAVSLSSRGDTFIYADAFFTNDTNANNSVVAQIKKTGTSTWTTVTGTTALGAGFWQTGFLGLDVETSYDIRFTFSDPDGVTGTNPISATISTTGEGVDTGVLSVSNIGATSVDVKATYTRDSDNDSTAILDYRITSFEQQVGLDAFSDGSNVVLSSHTPDIGGTWLKHASSTSGNNGDFIIYNNRATLRTVLTSDVAHWYLSPSALPQTEYEVQADFHVMALQGNPSVVGRWSATPNTGYTFSYNSAARRWELYKTVSDAWTLLGSYDQTLNIGEVYTAKLVIRSSYKICYVNGIERIRSTDNAISSTGFAGIRHSSVADATPFNHITIDNFIVTYRDNTNTFAGGAAMTADRGNKWFTRNVTGLTSDAVYEFRVTYANASDSVRGPNPLSIVAQTIGQAVQLSSIGASAQPTSAVVDIFYLFDTNNNSALSVQYRSTMSHLWTTVPTNLVTVNRGAKKFSTTITSLKPSMTYEVKATVSDPNGLIEGTLSELTTLFTTQGAIFETQKQNKHYLWKIYNKSDQYITTWHDAGEPEFAWHENGGVSDLSTTLPRRINEVDNVHSGIDYQNRIDVWCNDPSSNGFGPNLLKDSEFTLGMWTIGANAGATYTANAATVGPDGSEGFYLGESLGNTYVTRSENIMVFRQEAVGGGEVIYPIPLVVEAVAKARGGKLMMYVEAYDVVDVKIDQSDQTAETVGSDWQFLKVEYTPPAAASYIRVALQNSGNGNMYADKVTVRPKELLIYRGKIESFTPTIDQSGERIELQILGMISLLSDDYIEFLQFVNVQPQKDFDAQRPNNGAADPSVMLRKIIDTAHIQNAHFTLYYTDESIRNTGTFAQYTFRDQQIRSCFDKVRSLAPPGWHYYIEPDGLVSFRGPEHAVTHVLRLGVEVMNFSVEKSIRNLKNFIHVKGRQDEDESEPDGFGSIHHIAFDQASISKYGKRMLFIRDANITDPDTAEIVASGRLEEYNREEQRAQCHVPDDKSITYVGGALRGYNIEAFRPGDNIVILDPIAGPRNTYWDQFTWDEDVWDSTNTFAVLPEAVPIKTVQFHGSEARLDLSERQPSGTQDFGRLYRWLQLQDADKGEEN